MMKQYRNGFTLIELLVVIALVSVLLMIAAPSFQDFLRSSRLSSQTNTLVAALHSAKGEAIKNNMPSYLVPNDVSNWNNGWMVFVDTEFNQTYEVDDDPLILQTDPLPSNLKLTGNGTATAGTPYVSFDGSGFPRKKDGSPANLVLTFKLDDVDASQTSNFTRNIIIAKTGRVRTCKPVNANDSSCSSSTLE